jgi:hypothetical protein
MQQSHRGVRVLATLPLPDRSSDVARARVQHSTIAFDLGAASQLAIAKATKRMPGRGWC